MAYRDAGRQRPDLIHRAEANHLKFAERKLSPEELADGIDAYFKECSESSRRPTKPGLCLALGISTSTWDNWMREGEGKEVKRSLKSGETGAGRFAAYVWPMKRALMRISDELEQRSDAAGIFLMKQSCYNGYSDRADNAALGGAMSVNITFGETHKNTARNWGK